MGVMYTYLLKTVFRKHAHENRTNFAYKTQFWPVLALHMFDHFRQIFMKSSTFFWMFQPFWGHFLKSGQASSSCLKCSSNFDLWRFRPVFTSLRTFWPVLGRNRSRTFWYLPYTWSHKPILIWLCMIHLSQTQNIMVLVDFLKLWEIDHHDIIF